MRTKTWLPALLAVCCALVSACVADDTLVRDTEADLATGWLHGNCLALDDAEVRAGSPVAVVRLGEVQQVVTAKVTGRADGAGECLALLDDRRHANLASGLAFYTIDVDAEMELGIGVVQTAGSRALTVMELLDTNGDGRRDGFGRCSTSEGVRFSVWADEVGLGTPLWTGYYYLGYDTEADCPENR